MTEGQPYVEEAFAKLLDDGEFEGAHEIDPEQLFDSKVWGKLRGSIAEVATTSANIRRAIVCRNQD